MKPKLKEGEVICSECNGMGTGKAAGYGGEWMFCQKCHGVGTLDWVENVVGKKLGEVLRAGYSRGSDNWKETR